MCSLTLAGSWIVNLYVNIIALENETLSNLFFIFKIWKINLSSP